MKPPNFSPNNIVDSKQNAKCKMRDFGARSLTRISIRRMLGRKFRIGKVCPVQTSRDLHYAIKPVTTLHYRAAFHHQLTIKLLYLRYLLF
jgi:hypothetical protein